MNSFIRRLSGSSARAVRALSAFVMLFILVLCLSAGSAWSIGASSGAGPLKESRSSPSPAAAADPCLPLLDVSANAPGRDAPPSAMDGSRRSAGKAAVLGMALGVRSVPGPVRDALSLRPGNARSSLSVRASHDDSVRPRALAVADYRRCANERALRVLPD